MPPSDHHPSPARVFEIVWSTLVGVLGRPATATLFRRAAKNAARHRPELAALEGFDIIYAGREYGFELPPSWNSASDDAFEALRYLVQEQLRPILEELTGRVVIRLLEKQPELALSGLIEEPGDRT